MGDNTDRKSTQQDQELSVDRSQAFNSNNNNNPSYMQDETFQESQLLELAKKSPQKKQTEMDLLEYAACKSKRTLEESQQLSPRGMAKIHERLYNESFIMQDKQDKKDSLYFDNIKSHCSESKMIPATNKVLINKLEKTISNAIQEIVGEEKQLTFEQLGRLMTVLDIFRVIFYDTNCQFTNQELFDDESQMQNKRKFQEMVLHEQFWGLLAGSQTEESISVQLVWCVIRILLDHAKISVPQRASIIQEYLEKFREKPSNLSEIIEFLKYWQEMNVDNMSYKKIGYLKPNKFEEYMKAKSDSLTFKPKINAVNYLLESHNTATFLEKHPIDGVNPEYYQSINLDYENQFYSKTLSGEIDRQALSRISVQSPTRTMDRVKLLYKKQEVRDRQVEQMQQTKDVHDHAECTFQPDVSINRRVNDWSVLSKYGSSGIFERLYTLDPLIEREMRHQAKQQDDERREVEECSFTPAINRGLVTNDIHHKLEGKDLVRGYDKQVGRIRYGQQQKDQLKEKLEHIPKGEHYEEVKNKGINIPTMMTRGKPKKRVPFYTIEVSMRAGKNGRIALYDGDDPYVVTNNFAKSFQITGDNKNELFLRVKTQIDLHNAKMKQKKYGNMYRKQQQQQQQNNQNGNGYSNGNNGNMPIIKSVNTSNNGNHNQSNNYEDSNHDLQQQQQQQMIQQQMQQYNNQM